MVALPPRRIWTVPVRWVAGGAMVGAMLAGVSLSLAGSEMPAAAQVQQFLLGPGSSVGEQTKVKPKNCTTGSDGSITCDTVLENPPGNTPAKPSYTPFSN